MTMNNDLKQKEIDNEKIKEVRDEPQDNGVMENWTRIVILGQVVLVMETHKKVY